MTIEQARSLLARHGQSHLLAFWERLDPPARAGLLRQIEELDFEATARMRALLEQPPQAAAAASLEPAEVVEHTPAQREAARALGIAALREGRVGVILVAGGQGSRLGYDGPKGCYPIGPVTESPLFHFHARKVLALERRWGRPVPLYVMTSPINDAATRAFFASNASFGLDARRVFFFPQAMWPALDAQGRIVLDAPGHIFRSPDGHGGMLAALQRNGCLADMAARGLTLAFYLQVDNPLVDIADPAFLGEHLRRQSDYSLKVCPKRDPSEGLGVVVRQGATGTRVVEYSELTDEEKSATRPDGRLRFLFGSVAIHVFSVDFLRREADAGLPLHLAHKKVPVCDAEGRTVPPGTPNVFKFEKFIFDALADARHSCCLAFDRTEEFSPLKNAEGGDSPATCRRDLSTKWARWLLEAGVPVELDAEGCARHRIEIDPCYALDAAALAERLAAEGRTPDGGGDLLLAGD